MTSKVENRHVSALLGGWVQAAPVVVTCRVNVWEADKNVFLGFDVFRNSVPVVDVVSNSAGGGRFAGNAGRVIGAICELGVSLEGR